MDWAAWIVGAYVLGAIPFGVLVARSRGVDILRAGSGNPGATNVWRSCGPVAGLGVFVLDFAKGLGPALIGLLVFGSPVVAFALGLAATVGHLFSPFLRFGGGKGMATGFGMLAGTDAGVALSAFGVFLIVVSLTRYVSLASVVAAVSIVFFGYLYQLPPVLVACFAGVSALLVWKHRDNLKRLLEGSERRFALLGSGRSTPRSKADSEAIQSDEHSRTMGQ